MGRVKAKAKPEKNTQPNTADAVTDEDDPLKEVENYNVMYSKHMKQNVKTWEEGLLSFHPKQMKLCLFTRTSRTKNVG